LNSDGKVRLQIDWPEHRYAPHIAKLTRCFDHDSQVALAVAKEVRKSCKVKTEDVFVRCPNREVDGIKPCQECTFNASWGRQRLTEDGPDIRRSAPNGLNTCADLADSEAKFDLGVLEPVHVNNGPVLIIDSLHLAEQHSPCVGVVYCQVYIPGWAEAATRRYVDVGIFRQ